MVRVTSGVPVGRGRRERLKLATHHPAGSYLQVAAANKARRTALLLLLYARRYKLPDHYIIMVLCTVHLFVGS